jgi:hypothetical protein
MAGTVQGILERREKGEVMSNQMRDAEWSNDYGDTKTMIRGLIRKDGRRRTKDRVPRRQVRELKRLLEASGLVA